MGCNLSGFRSCFSEFVLVQTPYKKQFVDALRFRCGLCRSKTSLKEDVRCVRYTCTHWMVTRRATAPPTTAMRVATYPMTKKARWQMSDLVSPTPFLTFNVNNTENVRIINEGSFLWNLLLFFVLCTSASYSWLWLLVFSPLDAPVSIRDKWVHYSTLFTVKRV